MDVLISSAHYYLSDKIGSEPKWGIDYANEYSKICPAVYVVAGICDISTSLPSNVKIYSLFKKRTSNLFIETLLRSLYPVYAFSLSLFLLVRHIKSVKMVHHLAPASQMSYDILFIIRKLFPKSIVFIFGPVFPTPVSENVKESFRISSGANSQRGVSIVYRIVKTVTPILIFLSKLSLKHADYVVAATPEAQECYLHFTDGLNIKVIPLGATCSSYSNKVHLHKPINILSLSYLVYRKGTDTLLKAINHLVYTKKCTDFTVTIVGDGPEKTNLEQLSRVLKIKAWINFAGFVKNQGVGSYYSQGDIFCSPTRNEPFGMTIVEALCNGLAVIASDVNSLKYTIGSGGVVFEKDNYVDLANKLYLLIQNPVKLTEIKELAVEHGKSYRWENIISQYLKLLPYA